MAMSENIGHKHEICQSQQAENTDPCTNYAVKYATARGHLIFLPTHSNKPLTRVSKPAPGVRRKGRLERGWPKRLAKGWRRVGGFPCTLQLCNS